MREVFKQLSLNKQGVKEAQEHLRQLSGSCVIMVYCNKSLQPQAENLNGDKDRSDDMTPQG